MQERARKREKYLDVTKIGQKRDGKKKGKNERKE